MSYASLTFVFSRKIYLKLLAQAHCELTAATNFQILNFRTYSFDFNLARLNGFGKWLLNDNSCVGRCDDRVDPEKPCQCNDACNVRYLI